MIAPKARMLLPAPAGRGGRGEDRSPPRRGGVGRHFPSPVGRGGRGEGRFLPRRGGVGRHFPSPVGRGGRGEGRFLPRRGGAGRHSPSPSGRGGRGEGNELQSFLRPGSTAASRSHSISGSRSRKCAAMSAARFFGG